MAPKHNQTISSFTEIPFSALSDLYRDLRAASVIGKKRGIRFSKGNAENRRDLLTRTWIRLAQLSGKSVNTTHVDSTEDGFVPARVFPPEESFKLISLITPALDSAHAYMGMKETKLAEAFIKALDLVYNGEDAQWLKHHKEKAYRPKRFKQDSEIVDGNLATVLKAFLKDRCPSQSSLTIGIVWKALDLLSQAPHGRARRIGRLQITEPKKNFKEETSASANDPSSNQEDKRSIALISLVSHGTAEEVAEVARIILKDLDIRLSEDVFLNWFHPGAKQHYTQIHDIHKLLADCFDPKFEIGEASVQVGQYASVMLTMRPSRKQLDVICRNLRGQGRRNIEEEVTQSPYFIMEPKLDGERLQLHKWKVGSNEFSTRKYEIRTFSRRGNDSSPMYAEALREVVMNSVKAEDIILDGEIMIWDDLKASWLPFEDVREVTTAIAKKNIPVDCSYILKYMVFDILYVDQGLKTDGSVRRSANMVIRLPLHQRRALLSKLIHGNETEYGKGVRVQLELVDMEKGYDEKQLTQALQRYETLGYEGVIGKNPDMPYALAERNLEISIKLKPDYFDGGIQDLDVIILGAKFSQSSGHRIQRAGKLSSFLIGVRASKVEMPQWRSRDEVWEERMRSCKWIPVGSVGTGYSDRELEELQKKFEGQWKDFDSKDLPRHFEQREYAPTLFTNVAKWIQPWNSVVLAVRAFEVNRRYYALRFPRVERINWEKPYYDVPDFYELLDLDEHKQPAVVRPDENDADDVGTAPGKKRRKGGFDMEEEQALNQAKEEGYVVTGGRNARTVIGSATGADVKNVRQLSTAFQGLSCLVIASDTRSKEEIEVKIYELGGSFTQNFTPDVDFVVYTIPTLSRVQVFKDKFSNSAGDHNTCSIIHSGWIEECHHLNQKVLPQLEHVLYATKKLESELYKTADRFGDPWEEKTNAGLLWQSLKKACKWSEDNNIQSEIFQSHSVSVFVASSMHKAGNIFHEVLVHAPATKINLSGCLALLKAMGAREVRGENSGLTHVLVHSSLFEQQEHLTRANVVVITEKWVYHCVDAGKLIPMNEHGA